MHNRQAINLKLLWKSLCDFDLWPIYIFGLIWEIPSGPPDQYLTLTLRNLGFGTFDANLLSIPTQAMGAITMCIMTYLSTKWNERSFFGVFTQLWYLPNLIALSLLSSSSSPWVQFAVVTVLLSYPSRASLPLSLVLALREMLISNAAHAMHVGWASSNSNSVRTRAVSAALYK